AERGHERLRRDQQSKHEQQQSSKRRQAAARDRGARVQLDVRAGACDGSRERRTPPLVSRVSHVPGRDNSPEIRCRTGCGCGSAVLERPSWPRTSTRKVSSNTRKSSQIETFRM